MALPALIAFVAGEDALAEDVNTNFDRIAGRFNAGILDEDLSPSANIKGYKISSAAGDRVPETRLENNAVSARVLQSDLSAGAPLAAVATAAHIKDGIITSAKLAAGAGKVLLVSTAFSLGYTTIWPATPYAWAVASGLVVPAVNYAVASYDVVGVYIVGLSAPGTMYSAGAWADSALTNWRAGVCVGASAGGTFSGSVVLVLQSKV
jgi:hypothetical protein